MNPKEASVATDPDAPKDWKRRKFVFDSLFVGGLTFATVPIVRQTLRIFAAGNKVDNQVDGQYPQIPKSTIEPAQTQIAQLDSAVEGAVAEAAANGSTDVYVHLDDPQQLTTAYEVIGRDAQRTQLRNELLREQVPIRDFSRNIIWTIAETVGAVAIAIAGIVGSERIRKQQHPVSAELQ